MFYDTNPAPRKTVKKFVKYLYWLMSKKVFSGFGAESFSNLK